MTTNNEYFKQILETLTGETVTGTHSDNYYLKRIAICYGYSYLGNECNGKYIKDIAEAICQTTYTATHFRNWYLHRIAEEVYSGELTQHNDNYLLGIIAENISPSSRIILYVSPSPVVVGNQVTLTATLLDMNDDPIENATITFKAGGITLGTNTTSSLGVATYNYTPANVGTVSLSAEYTDCTGTANLIVTKHTSSISASANHNAVYVGDTVTVSGTLLIDGVGTSGLSIDIYEGSTKKGTVTTSNGGAYTYTTSAYTTRGSVVLKAKYDGDATHDSATSNDITVTISKKSTSLEITVPALVYSDIFDVTGVLTDMNNVAVSNASVKLYMETGGEVTLEATETTNSNGEVTFHRSAPTTITNYKFWLVYYGDSAYNNSISSEVTRTVGKETSVLNVTVPATIKSDFTITGTLLTNDGEAIANASIWIEKSSTHASIRQTTTDNNGEFSVNIPASQLSTGSNSLRVGFTNTDYYTASVQNITVTKVVPESLSLTSDKSILSYNDTESATLTATVTGSDSNPYSGATVIMGAYKVSDDSLVDTLSVTDNGDGTYSGTYVSGGVGDIYIKAECNLVSETFSIEDCLLYQDMATILSNWSKDTSVSERTIYKLTPNYQSDVELTFKIANSVPSNFLCGFGETGTGSPIYWSKAMFHNENKTLWYFVDNSDIRLGTSTSTNTVFKLTTESLHKVNAYLDDSLQAYHNTNTSRGLNLRIDSYTATPLTLEYLKVKPL